MVREDSVISCHGAVEARCSPGLQWPCEQVRPVGSEGCLLPAFPWPLLSGFFPAGTSQRLNGQKAPTTLCSPSSTFSFSYFAFTSTHLDLWGFFLV